MKKIIITLISLVMLTSMFSSLVSAQEEMTSEQMQAVFDDYQKNYIGKTYTYKDWVYSPEAGFTYNNDYDPINAEITGMYIVFVIDKYNNKNATSVKIPSSIDGHKISGINGRFKSNTKLKKATYSNGLKSTGVYAFKNHKNLRKVILPESITNIGIESFHNCKKLEKVILPKNTVIHNRAFKDCKNLKTLEYKGTSEFDSIIFYGAKKGETRIGEEAFANCVKLQKINLGKTREIEDNAFENCRSLKSITLPKNMTAIYDEAFLDCKKLSKVTVKSTKNAPLIGEDAFENTKKGIKFYVKNKKVAKSLKKQLKDSGVRNAKILIGKKVVYKNVK